jgi:fatty-acyl-CoA synthase
MAERPTYALGVPTIWMTMLQLLDEKPERYRLPPHMRMLVGGAPVPEAMIRAYKRHGAQICHGWGMTEMSPLGTVSYIKPELQHLSEEERIGRYAMAGVPAPIMDIRLVAEDGSECAWDGKSVGEVQVRGVFIAGGYHDVPNEPEKFTADGWLRTGDVATIDADRYVWIVDRKKDLIVSGGINIAPIEVETVIAQHPDVVAAGVCGVPDPLYGEAVHAAVVCRPGSQLSEDEVVRWCTERLASVKKPRSVAFVDVLPISSTGKLLRRELRAATTAESSPSG